MKLRLVNISTLFYLIISKLAFNYIYVNGIFVDFSYEGYQIGNNLIKQIIGWTTWITFAVIFSSRSQKSSIGKLILLIYILPIIIIYENDEYSYLFLFLILLPVIIISITPFNNAKKIKFIKFPVKKTFILYLNILLIVLLLLRISIISNFQFNINLLDVYDFRDEFGDIQDSGIFGYLNSWVTKISLIIPFLYALYSKKYKYIFVGGILSFLFFIFTGHKFLIFYPLLAILIYLDFSKKIRFEKLFSIFSILFCFLITTPLGLLLNSFIIRRTFFLPALINFNYLEFFSNNPKLNFSQSLLRGFTDSFYFDKFQLIIGDYMGFTGMWANTGFVGTSYMNLGIIGVVIYCFIMYFLFYIIFSYLKDRNNYIILTLFTLQVVTFLTSADLFTTLLTNGLFIIIISIFFKEKLSKSKK